MIWRPTAVHSCTSSCSTKALDDWCPYIVGETHRGLGLDHVIWALAAAAVAHGFPGILVEDDAEEEDEGTLDGQTKGRGSQRNQWSKVPIESEKSEKKVFTWRQLNPANK